MRKCLKVFATSFIIAGALSALASCGNNKIVDYTADCKLTRDFANKKFAGDGIEEATLVYTTDGDTSTFRTVNTSTTYTIRYLGIDTPESTAGYEKWGKAASLWNANILNNAYKIVLESNDYKVNYDSNGTRVLAYVWYKATEDSEWRNLNIETVQEGYSDYTGTSSSIKEEYHEAFTKACDQATEKKLKVHGDEEDKYYPTTIQEVTLKELNENYDNYYDKENDIPTHVAFDAYLVDLTFSSSSFINATVEQIVDNKAYQFDITVGYSTSVIGQKFTSSDKGTLYHIVGFTMSSKSIHGLVPKTLSDGPEYTIQKVAGYSMKFESAKVTQIISTSSDIVRVKVKIGSKYFELAITKSDATFELAVGDQITTENRYSLDSSTNSYSIPSSDIKITKTNN